MSVRRAHSLIRVHPVLRSKQARDRGQPRRYAASNGGELDTLLSVRGHHKVIPYGEPQPCTPPHTEVDD